jgi:hypothetical protein
MEAIGRTEEDSVCLTNPANVGVHTGELTQERHTTLATVPGVWIYLMDRLRVRAQLKQVSAVNPRTLAGGFTVPLLGESLRVYTDVLAGNKTQATALWVNQRSVGPQLEASPLATAVDSVDGINKVCDLCLWFSLSQVQSPSPTTSPQPQSAEPSKFWTADHVTKTGNIDNQDEFSLPVVFRGSLYLILLRRRAVL